METMPPSDRVIRLEANQLKNRTFLLGNEGGFILHLPVELNVRDQTLVPIKWFGASEFGRKYLEADRVWFERDGQSTSLSRSNQVEFVQEVSEAVRTFRVDGVMVRQRFFVPNRLAGFVMTLESDLPGRFVIEPQFDMRYYQAFNTDFSGYKAGVAGSDREPVLCVSNQIRGPNDHSMSFYCTIRSIDQPVEVALSPDDRRLLHRRYLKDEHREKVIHKVYDETHDRSPDEAPIWDSYTNTVYVPGRLHVESPATLVYAFDEKRDRAESLGEDIATNLTKLYRENQDSAQERLQTSVLTTGNSEVDRAYRHVLSRFNSALVARDVNVGTGSQTIKHFTAIFAGDKYFLDAWKRDENISLGALLDGNDYETMRTILANTWQHQDERTGRLPHIIRLGQPLVYFCSDGTPWALRRLAQYTKVSGDHSLMDEKYGMVEHFFAASLPFVRRGLLPSGGIIQPGYLWETWEDTAYTPRDGYPVEIELLWLKAIEEYLPVIHERNHDLAQRLQETLDTGLKTFERFYLDGYLADSLDYRFEPRELLTPNGYIAFDVDFPLPSALARSMVLVARKQLAGIVGVKSLAPRDWPKVFNPAFLQDPDNTRGSNMGSFGIYNYHRGIEWLWLNQFLLLGELKYGDTDTGYQLYVRGLIRSALEKSGAGGLDELTDLHGPLGADFQAWSMASLISSLHHFAGIDVDSRTRCVSVMPSIPHDWPELLCRARVEKCRFDVTIRHEDARVRIISIEALDPIPRGYELEVGTRMTPGQHIGAVTVNGQPVSRHEQRVVSQVDGGPGEVWIKTGFDERVSVCMEIGAGP